MFIFVCKNVCVMHSGYFCLFCLFSVYLFFWLSGFERPVLLVFWYPTELVLLLSALAWSAVWLLLLNPFLFTLLQVFFNSLSTFSASSHFFSLSGIWDKWGWGLTPPGIGEDIKFLPLFQRVQSLYLDTSTFLLLTLSPYLPSYFSLSLLICLIIT